MNEVKTWAGNAVGRSMKKTDVLNLVEALSDNGETDVDELIDTLDFRRAVEKGLAAADAGDEISFEEFEQLSESWLALP
jgi:Zn-dependent alcohol dehydrogenase